MRWVEGGIEMWIISLACIYAQLHIGLHVFAKTPFRFQSQGHQVLIDPRCALQAMEICRCRACRILTSIQRASSCIGPCL